MQKSPYGLRNKPENIKKEKTKLHTLTHTAVPMGTNALYHQADHTTVTEQQYKQQQTLTQTNKQRSYQTSDIASWSIVKTL